MIKPSGSLTYKDYKNLFNKKNIFGNNFKDKQFQPSSVDLTLSAECYEIKASFLSSSQTVRKNIEKIKIKKINLSKKYIFKKNKTFIVRLNENLNLPNNIFGMCNPKSSAGRLDIFCRTILNFSNEYEKIPLKYKGEMFIEITSKSFDIEFQKGDSLNQMRLVFNKNLYVSDNKLKIYHNKKFLTKNNLGQKITPILNNGLKISVDLSSNNQVSAYVAKKNAPCLNFKKVKFHLAKNYWIPVKTKDGRLLIKKNKFYILKSKEKIQIPNNMAGVMIPYDTGLGDYRVHYAGFFDPGFGHTIGSHAVLEVKTNEVSFILEDGQSIARIKYEMLNKESKIVYGEKLNSNYQNQNLALSKHFV